MGIDKRSVVAAAFLAAILVCVQPHTLNAGQADETLDRNKRQTEKTPFTFDDWFSGDYSPRGYYVYWTSENKYRYITSDGDLGIYNLDTNTTEVLVTADVLAEFGTSTYFLSADQRYLLLEYNREKVWRRSYSATYKIYDRQAAEPDQRYLDFPNLEGSIGARLQYAGWSPTGHKLLFVMNNDLYYQADPQSQAQDVTRDGQFETRFNGVTDWLYEEDVTARRTTIYWSPDSQRFMYASLDTSNVPRYEFPHYRDEEDVFGDIVTVAYPKAGDVVPDRNTKVNLYISQTDNIGGALVQLTVPPELANQEHYFTQVSWSTPTDIYVVWANRLQNHTVGMYCEPFSGTCQKNYERQQPGGWINPGQTIRWVNDGQGYLTIWPRREADENHWKQLALMTTPLIEQGAVSYLTQGQAEVTSIRGYDAARRIAYYTSTNGDPTILHLFRVGLEGSDISTTPECLTCDLGTDCQYNTASFSPAAKFYVEICLGPGIPRYTMRATDYTMGVVLQDNAEVKARLDTKLLPSEQYMQVPIGGGYQGTVRMWLPPNFDPQQKYPVLVNTYAGPGSQFVTQRYSIGWQTYLASSENVIYASIDGRGTRGRGDEFMHLMYRKIGTIEIEDQVLAGKYFAENLSYVNGSAMGIWGWSYGGFTTLHALAHEMNVYGCGISVAALTDQRFYDTAYSERFMDLATPADNQAGYEAGNVLSKIENFRNKTLLVVHGIADDNVHWLTTGQLVRALTDANIQFHLQLYPDKDHGIRGGNTRRHLYRKFTNFVLKKCWGLTPSV